jgi:protein-S-isoprenylcysteine O-methyltransferase Ste14
VAAYLLFLGASAYLIGFLANVVVPKGIDDGAATPVGLAVAVDVALVSLFGLQHSVMARPWFKRRWTRLVPAALERSTYVAAVGLVVGLMVWLWRPLPAPVWSVGTGWPRDALWIGHGLGWAAGGGRPAPLDRPGVRPVRPGGPPVRAPSRTEEAA